MLSRLILASTVAIGFSLSASAADFSTTPPPAPAPEVPVVPTSGPYDWNGVYFNGSIGGEDRYGRFDDGAVVGSSNGGAFVGGVGVGYNFQSNYMGLGQWVVGGVVDANFGTDTGTTHYGSLANGGVTITNRFENPFFSTYRLRAGYAVGDALLYVTGGAVLGDVSNKYVYTQAMPAAIAAGSKSSMQLGWTVGAGLEYGLTRNWTVDGEYLHIGYTPQNYTAYYAGAPVWTVKSSQSEDLFRAGLNYKW